jgi:hypothetical protein
LRKLALLSGRGSCSAPSPIGPVVQCPAPPRSQRRPRHDLRTRNAVGRPSCTCIARRCRSELDERRRERRAVARTVAKRYRSDREGYLSNCEFRTSPDQAAPYTSEHGRQLGTPFNAD